MGMTRGRRGTPRRKGTLWVVRVDGPHGRVVGFEKGAETPDEAVACFRRAVPQVPAARQLAAVRAVLCRTDTLFAYTLGVHAVAPGVWAYDEIDLTRKLG